MGGEKKVVFCGDGGNHHTPHLRIQKPSAVPQLLCWSQILCTQQLMAVCCGTTEGAVGLQCGSGIQ